MAHLGLGADLTLVLSGVSGLYVLDLRKNELRLIPVQKSKEYSIESAAEWPNLKLIGGEIAEKLMENGLLCERSSGHS